MAENTAGKTAAAAPTTILGIFNGDNASVTLVRDGKVLYAAQEERFNRVKLSRGYPELAIADCFARTGITAADIDVVACGAWSYPDPAAVADYFASAPSLADGRASERLHASLKADEPFKREFFVRSRELFPDAELKTYDHHLSHALTAFYPSPFEESWIITADGRGDLSSTVVWKASRAEGITRVKTFSELKSLGSLYGQVTGLLGFKPFRHEGKLTGLAAFGKPTDLVDAMASLIHFDGEDFAISKQFRPFSNWDYKELAEMCDGYSKEDVAFAVQNVFERAILDLITAYIPSGSNVCLAGGCFGNVKLNQRVREHSNVAGTYVFPEMGDGGNSFGGALGAAVDAGLTHIDVADMYLGPDFTINEAELVGLRVERFADATEHARTVAQLLVDDKVVGVCTGRMEYGPRALGARSIMISACNAGVNDSVNKRLNRTEFMPFAPVTLAEHAAAMYVDYSPADVNLRYMTTCYDCTAEMKAMSPAVVHVDGTARPQLVGPEYGQPLYTAILTEYHKLTGIPNLVNTSFNNHEEPIVCNLADALSSLVRDNVDCVVTDGVIIWAK